VIWGEGKIWKVDVASGQGAPVPFTAHVEQTLNEALRFPQKVHAPDFQVKALRNVAVSPDGKRVAYGALGHVYVKDLPGGEPKRVTNNAAFESRRSDPPTAADRCTRRDRRRLRPRPRRLSGRQRRTGRRDHTGQLHRAGVLT
jgi:hypothetical protein